MRQHLPKRRPHVCFDLDHFGIKWTCGIGYFENAPMEVWINCSKSGTSAETMGRDAAVVLSLALQFGAPVDVMRRSITRNPDGSPSGPIGAILDRLSEEA